MSGGWFRVNRGPDLDDLLRRPNDLTLAMVIASRVKWDHSWSSDGLIRGEARLGDHRTVGMTRQQYRSSLDRLVKSGLITIKTTNKGTTASLTDSRIFRIWGDDGQPAEQPAESGLSTGTHRPNQLSNQQTSKNQPAEQPAGQPVQIAADVRVVGFHVDDHNQLSNQQISKNQPAEQPLSKTEKTKDRGSEGPKDGRPEDRKTQDGRPKTEDGRPRPQTKHAPQMYPRDVKIVLAEVRAAVLGMRNRYSFHDPCSRNRARLPAEFDKYKRMLEREKELSEQLCHMDLSFPKAKG